MQVVPQSATPNEPATLDDEDEEHEETYSSYSDFQLFRNWLKSLSQWERVLSSLESKGGLADLIKTQGVAIHRVAVPVPHHHNLQASLERTLISFCDKADEIAEARVWLRKAAASRV